MNRYSQPFLLSSEGSDRATAYCFTNKIVTRAGKTHVVWTDAPAQTRGRTFDHAQGQWGPTIDIGAGVDNHNSPSLTADKEGRLHVSYGAHGAWGKYVDYWPSGAFKWSVSPQANSLEGIGAKTQPVGYHGTYSFLLHTPAGWDCLAYRGGEAAPSLMFQRQRAAGGWENAQTIMVQDIPPGYTHWGPFLACDRAGTLYLCGHVYSEHVGSSVGVAIVKSADGGSQWTDLAGQAAATPIRYAPRFAIPHPPQEDDPRNWGVAFDARERLWAVAGKQGKTGRGVLLSCWTGSGWETSDVGRFLPAERIPLDGGMTIDSADRIHVVIAAALAQSQRNWGDASNEVFHLCSSDGGKTFSCNQISPSDSSAANWLPIISRPGPFYTVEKPLILYTHGPTAGKPPTTEVWAVQVESVD